MTTILKTLQYARIGINRGQGDDLQRKTGIRQLNQAMDLLEQGYPLDADIENPGDSRVNQIAEMEAFHPRAMKLLRKRKNFIVIADDEPYYIQAYDLIRDAEKSKGTWSKEDEDIYQQGKEEADMGPKATTPAGKNSGKTKPSSGKKQTPRPTAKPAK